MTTSKPEVKRYDCTSGGSSHCYGCYTMTETEYGEYVSAEDFEALQAECEKLRKEGGLVERLAKILPEIDDALEDLELHGTHSDKGYVKLKAWYRRMASTINAIDAAMQEDQP